MARGKEDKGAYPSVKLEAGRQDDEDASTVLGPTTLSISENTDCFTVTFSGTHSYEMRGQGRRGEGD